MEKHLRDLASNMMKNTIANQEIYKAKLQLQDLHTKVTDYLPPSTKL